MCMKQEETNSYNKNEMEYGYLNTRYCNVYLKEV